METENIDIGQMEGQAEEKAACPVCKALETGEIELKPGCTYIHKRPQDCATPESDWEQFRVAQHTKALEELLQNLDRKPSKPVESEEKFDVNPWWPLSLVFMAIGIVAVIFKLTRS